MTTIINHTAGFTSYNLNLLNDKQRTSLFQEFDQDEILHIGISDNKKDIKVLTRTGDLYVLTFSILGVKSCELSN